LTIVAVGKQVHTALEAAQQLAKKGIETEVVEETILASVQ